MKSVSLLLKYYLLSYLRNKRQWFYEYFPAVFISICIMIGGIITPPALYFMAIYVFLIPFTYFSIGYSLLGEIMVQKSSGFKLYMKSCGVTQFQYQLYCLTISFCKTFFYCFIILLGVGIGAIIENESLDPFVNGDLVCNYLLAALASTTFVLFISAFYSQYKMATDTYTCLYLGVVVVAITILEPTPGLNFLSILLPPSNFIIGAFLSTNQAVQGFTLSSIYTILAIETFVYLVLYFYLDRVIEDGSGYAKHPCFFFKSNSKRAIEPMQESLLSNPPRENRVESTESFNNRKKDKKILDIFKVGCKNLSPEPIEEMTFELEQGDSLCLLGDNKQTLTNLLHLFSGVKPATTGEIRYEDKIVYPRGESVTSDVAVCCGITALNLKLTVREQMSMIERVRSATDLSILEILDVLKLQDHGDTMIENLSIKHKAKVCLGLVYLQGVRTVFIDDLAQNLSFEEKEEVLNDIISMKEKGFTIISAVGNLDEAVQLGNLIAIFHQGRLEKFGRGMFLSKEFNVGCHLRVLLKKEGIDEKHRLQLQLDAERHIMQIDGVTAEEDDKALCKFFVPFTSKFYNTLKDLQKKQDIIVEVKIDDVSKIFDAIEAKKNSNFNDKV